MSLRPGTRLGHYEIVALSGKGGMGEVYRSRDVRLDRTVAIKVLPAHFASDAEFRQRFAREAKAVAALSHPHICTLHDVGEEPHPDDPGKPIQFLVLEYLDGESLEETLRHKVIPPNQVLRTGIQIAAALATAHRSGIVHRDLKPGNIMLTAGGVKLLDFGLAKSTAAAVGAAGTETAAALTTPNTILGTPHYMSPEQVEGKGVDSRSDIFSLGAILYEMTTGKKAFDGNSAASVMAAIVDREPPPIAQVQPSASPLLDHVITRCLAKDPDERWQSAGDVMRELKWIDERHGGLSGPAAARASGLSRRERWLWAAALATLVIAAVLLISSGRRSEPGIAEMRLTISTPPTPDPFSLAISPDGEKVIYAAPNQHGVQLWLYRVKSGAAEPLPRTENAQFPFWSPDSASIGFAASGQLKRLDLESGAVRKIASAPLFLGGSWATDGSILFAPNTNSRIFRVSASGGDPVAVTVARPQSHHHQPQGLPDGRHFLYFEINAPQPGGVYVAALDGSDTRRLLDAEAGAVYMAPGYLLFPRKGSLWAQAFDPVRLTISGSPVQVVDQIMTRAFAGATLVPLSVANTGTILYRLGKAAAARFELRWRDRSGEELDKFPGLPFLLNPALSPDEQKLVFFQSSDLWLYDFQRRTLDKFTVAPALNFAGVWSPDSKRIVYCSNPKGIFDLYVKNATGAGGDELLLSTPDPKIPMDWSSDGQYILYRTDTPTTAYDIWAVSMKDRQPFPVLATEHEERNAQFSPDGKFIAYQSNETGRFEIWIRPFPFPGTEVKADDKVQVSINGGTQVRWSRNGTEVVYLAPDGTLLSMPVRIDPVKREITKGASVPLFSYGAILYGAGTALPSYAISADGKRILTTIAELPPVSNPVSILLNWQPPRPQ
jgi:eukaryotic-like serine/threonine-protein kinase